MVVEQRKDVPRGDCQTGKWTWSRPAGAAAPAAARRPPKLQMGVSCCSNAFLEDTSLLRRQIRRPRHDWSGPGWGGSAGAVLREGGRPAALWRL